MKNCTTKLLCFNTYEYLFLKNVPQGPYVDANKKKTSSKSLRLRKQLTESNWVLLGLTGSYLALLSLTVHYLVILGLTRPYWALVGLT